MSPIRVAQLIGLAASLLFVQPTAFGQVTGTQRTTIRINVVDYPRPVALAVRQIEKHFGYIVTYEDTVYVHQDDIVDVTEEVSRDRSKPTRILQMRNGTIDFATVPRPGTVESQVGEILQEVLLRSRASGNTGDYRVEWVPGAYHVIPVAFKAQNGLVKSYASPLEARITLPYREESAFEMMVRLANAITKSSGRRVKPGTMPLSRFERTIVGIEAHNDRARNVVWRALQSISSEMSWQLLCSVGEAGECALNVHPVRKK